MSRKIKVIVIESETELRSLLKQQKTKASHDKIEALFLLKNNQVNTIKELATIIERPYSTVCSWLRIYRREGLDILLDISKSQITKKKDKNKVSSHQIHLPKKLQKHSNTNNQPKLQTLIDIDGEVILYNKILTEKESDRLFKELNKISWRQDYIKRFGKLIPLPRLTAWYGDSDKSYTYSGINMDPETWSPALLLIKDKVEKLSDVEFNSVLLNLYRDGQDSVAWHSDDEPELGKNPIIASVSLGQTRRFMLKHKYRQDLESIKIDLTPGSLLLMRGETQHFWKHQVPKTRNCDKPRINLTFRIIQSGANDC